MGASARLGVTRQGLHVRMMLENGEGHQLALLFRPQDLFACVRDHVRERMRLGGVEAIIGSTNFHERATDGVRAWQQQEALDGLGDGTCGDQQRYSSGNSASRASDRADRPRGPPSLQQLHWWADPVETKEHASCFLKTSSALIH